MDPLVFEPYLRPQIWGGRALGERLGKPLPATGWFGESWELSAHPHHVSRVAEGPLRGALLDELWATRAEEVFGHAAPLPQTFPLLVKFLDCRDLLSIQVHPNDRLARELLGELSGKSEAWVVLQAEPGAIVYAGLLPGTTPALVERLLEAGRLADCLHGFAPKAGECLFLPAGTVHAAGGGVLLAEVQQPSDVTFRLFDWSRLASDGKPRPLHRAEALRSIDWSAGPVTPVRATPVQGLPHGVRGERLVACDYFALDRFWLAGPLEVPYAGRLSIWLVLEGSAELASVSGAYRRLFHTGETVLIPATAEGLHWRPAGDSQAATLLAVVPAVGM